MNRSVFKVSLIAILVLVVSGYTHSAMAYGIAGTTLDPAGNNASATDLAVASCPEGTHHFSAAVQDNSSPVNGLLVSVHIFKENKMTTATDSASGDGGWSDIISVNGGAGNYYVSIRKTNVGARNFTIGWDCQDANNNSTGTNIQVLQLQ